MMAIIRWIGLGVVWWLGVILAGAAAPPASREPDRDEELLRRFKIGTDDRSLLEFLRTRSRLARSSVKAEALIRRLGSDDFRERQAASAELIALEHRAIPPLFRAQTNPDKEIASRAKHCLQQIEPRLRASLPWTVVRRLLHRQPPGTIEALLRYLPDIDDPAVEEEIYFGLDRLTVRAGKIDPALAGALRDRAPARRAVAACIVGRLGSPEQKAAVRKLLKDADPWVRLRAAQGLLAGRDKAAIPVLIALLDQPQVMLTWQAEELLHYAAGEGAPEVTVGAGSAPARARCRVAWEAWARAHVKALDLSKEHPDHRRPGLLLVWSSLDRRKPNGQVWLYGCDGRPRWHMDNLPAPGRAVLPGDRVLFVEDGADRFTERDLSGKILWQFQLGKEESPVACRRLPGGYTLLLSHPEPKHRLRLVSKEGTVVFSSKFFADTSNGMTYLLPNGHILGFTTIEFKRNTSVWQAWEVDPLTAKHVPHMRGEYRQVYSFTPLPDGHVLVDHSGGVEEVDSSGRSVWKHPYKGLSAIRLRNGNTLMLGEGDPEVEPSGKVVRELMLKERMGLQECLPLVCLGFTHPRPAGWSVDMLANRVWQLKHKDFEIRYWAVEKLAEQGPRAVAALPALIDVFDDPAPDRRCQIRIRQALSRAVRRMGPKAVPHLLKSLSDKRPRIRAGVAGSLWRFPHQGEQIVPALLVTLGDKDVRVRAEAARSLGLFRSQASVVVPALMKAMDDKARDVVEAAVVSLGQMGPAAKPAVPRLGKALKDRRSGVAAGAAAALGKVGPEAHEAVGALLEAARTPTGYLRQEAIEALGLIGPKAKAAVPFLIEAFKDEEYRPVRGVIAGALGNIGPGARAAVPVLIKQLKERGDESRHGPAMAYALGKIGPVSKEVVPALIEALRRQEPDLPESAAQALGKIGPVTKEVVPALAEALKVPKRLHYEKADRMDSIRLAAAQALRRIGPPARAALPALIAVSKEQRWREGDDVCTGSAKDLAHAEAGKNKCIVNKMVGVDPRFQPEVLRAIQAIRGKP
jgi:HEAT repeat protein